MARKKKVELDGAEFSITPLTFEQVETWVRQRAEFGLDAPGFDVTAVDPNLLRRSVFENVICASLNNAKEINGEWTSDRVYKEMDKVLYEFVYAEILKFMGFASTSGTDSTEEVKAASGESNAVS